MRAAARFAATGRYLSLQYLQSIGSKPLDTFKKFATKNIGESINELSEKQVQELRRRIGCLSEMEGKSSGSGGQASGRSGQGILDTELQGTLGDGELRWDSSIDLNSKLFERAEWKNNDVEMGSEPIHVWDSESGEPIPGTETHKENKQPKTKKPSSKKKQADDGQLSLWDYQQAVEDNDKDNDNDTGETGTTQGDGEENGPVGGVPPVRNGVLGPEGPGQPDGGTAATDGAAEQGLAGGEQEPVPAERSGGRSESVTDMAGEGESELPDGGSGVRSGNDAFGRRAVRENLKKSGQEKKVRCDLLSILSIFDTANNSI